MKEVKVICPKCDNQMTYKNWFSWVLYTPFHWFGKRRVKCDKCGERSYVGKSKEKPIKIVYEGIEVTSDEDRFKMTIKLLSNIGEHNMAALDCSDMSEEEIEEIVGKWGEQYD